MQNKINENLNDSFSSLNLGIALFQVNQSGSPKDVELDKDSKNPLLKARKEIERTSQLLYCNPAYVKQSGFKKEELLAAQDIILLSERLDYMTFKMMKMAWKNLSQGLPYNGIASWKRPDGRQNLFEFNEIPLTYGGKYYALSITHDVTDYVQSQSELKQRHEWLVGACYDTIAQQAMINQAVQEVGTGLFPWIGQSCNRIIQLLEGSLDCSHFSHGQFLPNPEWVSVFQICQDLNESFAFQIQEKNLVLEFDLPLEPVQLWINPTVLSRMLQNLVGNAIEFINGGQVRLACKLLGRDASSQGLEWTVSVTKTGWLTGVESLHSSVLAAKKRGYSLASVQDLAQLIEGSVHLVGSPKGITISLPKTRYSFS